MNDDLVELIKIYGTGRHKEVHKYLSRKSKPHLISVLIDITTEYFNDKNSSSLREYLLVSLNGFVPLREKIGYDGYKQTSSFQAKEFCEAKPVNIATCSSKRKLNGNGNFTDYSWRKLQRHKQENPTMLVGGFLDGKIFFSVCFKFNFDDFTNRLEEQLMRQYPNGDETGKYLRSASFSLDTYKNSPDLEVKVFASLTEIEKHKEYMTSKLYSFLREHKK